MTMRQFLIYPAICLSVFLTGCVFDGSGYSGPIPVDDVFNRSQSANHGEESSDGLLLASAPSLQTAIKSYVEGWMGTPYRFGGASKYGIDCSGLVINTYRDLFGMMLPRRTREQASFGTRIKRKNLKIGDLVFFKTGFRDRHVGIYLGNNRFAHSSTKRGVMISSLSNSYWHKHYWKASRVLRI